MREPISAVVSPNSARVRDLSRRPGARPCFCEQVLQGKTGETSSQRSAKIGWGYAGGVGSALARRYGSPSCSVSTVHYESVLERETKREVVKPAVVDDSKSDEGTPSYVHVHVSLPLLRRLRGCGPTRLARMVVNVHASEYLSLACTLVVAG